MSRLLLRMLVMVVAILLVGCIGLRAYGDTETPQALPGPTMSGPSPTGPATAENAAVTATASPTPTLTPFPTAPPAQNEVLCWGFECGWRLQANNGSLKVSLGWTAFWGDVPAKLDIAQLQPRNCASFEPQVELEQHATHVLEGMHSARVIQAYRACAAGLYQVVEVKPGYLYVASALVFNWSTSNPMVDTASTSYVRSWVGLDPTGGTDYAADSVIWSPEEAARDHFGYLQVKARASGSRMTIFLLSIPNYPVSRSDSFWDLSALMEVGNPIPTMAPTSFVTPTPEVANGVFMVTPQPVSPALGVMLYDVVSNLRHCGELFKGAAWPPDFDPTTCPFVLDDAGGVMTVGQPGSGPAGVNAWLMDRYGNRWSSFGDAVGSLAAVACYKGLPRGKFYEGIQVAEYIKLVGAGAVLPVAENPCSIGG